MLKDKKNLRDKRPKLGKLLQDEENSKIKEKEVQFNDSENEEEGEGGGLSGLGRSAHNLDEDGTEQEVQFTDEGTTAMFGGEVSVTVDCHIAEQLDEASHVFSGKAYRRRRRRRRRRRIYVYHYTSFSRVIRCLSYQCLYCVPASLPVQEVERRGSRSLPLLWKKP